MTELFLSVLNLSISTGYLILAVLLVRLLLKKSPKWIHVLLWGLVAVRLLCPISLESALSLIPKAEVVQPEIMMEAAPTIDTGIPVVNEILNPVITESFTPEPLSSANPLQILIPVAANLWLLGVLGMAAYTVISYLRLRHSVGKTKPQEGNVYVTRRVSSPFILGVIRPRIYLPAALSEDDKAHVLAHEQMHLRRKDHWWKPLGFLLLTLHWFNPLMWIAYILLCRDIELACDEKVVGALSRQEKADYSQALLNCSVRRRSIAACPLAFGEVGVKQRVSNILNYKKPAFWVIVLAIALCIVVAVCFLTNPKDDTPPLFWIDYLESGTYPEDTLEMTLSEFPGVLFQCTPGAVQTLENGEATTLISGIPVWNVYCLDLTGDGIIEFCATVSYGSGIIDEHVVVYDYATKTEYTLWDRGEFDYILRQENGKLICDKLVYPHGELVESGELMLVSAGGGDGKRLEINSDGEKESKTVSFQTQDFSQVTAIKLSNAHNGKDTEITDPNAIASICHFLTGISGTGGRSSRGWHYQGTFALTLLAGEETVFEITFGDMNVFFYGMYDDKYSTMYDLEGMDIEDVVHYLHRYDESGFDWGYEETVVSVALNPYELTSTVPSNEVKCSATYLTPSLALGYGFGKDESWELGELLNSLLPESFTSTEGYDFSPTLQVDLSWANGSLTLYSDGEMTAVGEAAQWAVIGSGLDLNRFMQKILNHQLDDVPDTLPLTELPENYSMEAAMIDNVVVMIDGDIRDNQATWEAFLKEVSTGADAFVRVMHYYGGDDPSKTIFDLHYNDSSFTQEYLNDGTLYRREWNYLRHFSGEASDKAEYDAYDYYVLTNDPTSNWEEIWKSAASSVYGAAIPFSLIYMDQIYYTDYPPLPDSQVTELRLWVDDKILNIWSESCEEKMQQVLTMMCKAEGLGYEPKTYGFGPELEFVMADGNTYTVSLTIEYDLLYFDGAFYDFGPGYTEDGSINATPDLMRLLFGDTIPQEILDIYPEYLW